MCFCCRNKEIEKDDFQAGHILAEANGGTEVDNLVPICSQCNQGMGTMHMREYIEKFYSENLNKFDRREKPLKKKKKNDFLILEEDKLRLTCILISTSHLHLIIIYILFFSKSSRAILKCISNIIFSKSSPNNISIYGRILLNSFFRMSGNR